MSNERKTPQIHVTFLNGNDIDLKNTQKEAPFFPRVIL